MPFEEYAECSPASASLSVSTNKFPSSDYFVMAIGGVTCGGKSTLATRIARHFGESATIVTQDDYFLADDDPRHQCVAGLCHNNWDTLSALDMDRLVEDVRQTISRPCGRRPSVLIIEGHLVLNDDRVHQLCHVMYYITLPRDVCWQRRSCRHYDPPDVAGYFDTCVWPMYGYYRDQLKRAVVSSALDVRFVDGTVSLDVNEQSILSDLRYGLECRFGQK